MLDDMLDHLQTIREQPLWQAPSAAARASFHAALPQEPSDLAAVRHLSRARAALRQRLHADGRVAPSLTWLDDRAAIRVAIVNHRADETDIDALLNGVLTFGLQEDSAAC